MSEQLNLATFTGAHPSTGQLVEQLHAWGFRQLRVEGVHLVFRGPHGGTLRVLRSMLGRADAAVTAKAARLAEVEEPTFWAGPEAHARNLAQPTAPDTDSTTRALLDDAAAAREGRERPTHDQIIAVVLAVHVAMDQPLGFSQVVALADVSLTRSQVSGASSQLCRDGQLVRIRSGVYQWAEGSFTARPAPRPIPRQRARRVEHPASRPPAPAAKPARPVPSTAAPAAADLFEQLFPRGVTMTAELLADFEQWAQLTEKLTAYANAS
ncbi:hypothetical protein I4I73_23235 [Pseudonocardia sp. KRD-184]|uniref:MarR family transcriptional regulator n=1 Tax=Pseudonocardia oceani TaxID=2792013 RepID=A0ABS6UJW1_9PSEU|nr:hypothetical protein [Pseudonocardia oceani]MBW0091807.1 hypothetical protein [Pseudonocardia oceani]MBW0098910.1 hypothetical protein [Pseudonocardia oceani]MBW0108137.1 hypothetical protein [Pseudonocardia oceani]MBW0124816.1 hypothetical protein [Pseudonocardia oceani]MBW0132545.1 hypothetical protein [Pseudonocardia oceani]